MGLLRTLLLLSLAILAHEFGHYLAMRHNGVEVVELAVGFGPTLFQRTFGGGTVFMLKLLPLGGYTMPAPGAMEALGLAATEQVAFAGMLTNLLVAVPFLLLLFVIGKEPPFSKGRAEWLPRRLRPLLLSVILPFVGWLAVPFIIIGGLFRDPRRMLANASGPIGIVRDNRQAASSVGRAAAFWVGMNVSLAGFNLIPLLPLDGGHAALPLVAMLGETATAVYMIGSTILFAALFLLLIVNDFRKRPTAP